MSADQTTQWLRAERDLTIPGVGVLTVPPPLSRALDDVRALRATATATVSAADRAAWLIGLQHLMDAASVTFTEVLAQFDGAGDAEVLTGASSTTSWLSHRLRLAPGDASSRVKVARAADELAGPLDAVASGILRAEHVPVMEKAIRPLDDPEQRAQAVELLCELAERADPARVATAGRRLREVVDPDGALTSHEQQFTRRYLNLSPMLDGMTRLDGLLDAESTATLSAALSPLMVPAGGDDDRTTAQRRADAVVELATVAMREGSLPKLSGSSVALEVVVGVDTLRELERAPGVVLDHPGGGADLPGPAIGRLACDASIGRVVLGPDGVPLDLGRQVRLFSRGQRRALAVRDGGCRFPGCSRPPRFTDAHHLIPWQRGGVSDLSNAALLCRFHHRAMHEGGWGVTGDAGPPLGHGVLWFRGPAGQLIPSPPRGPVVGHREHGEPTGPSG